MNVLEQRYRRVLRMLPTSYREAWEEDMVATFLASVETDDADDAEYLADYGRPSWSEVASVAMLAIRLRVGGAGTPPLSVAWGEVVRALRLVALMMLLSSAVLAPMGVWRTFWLANEIPWFPAPAVSDLSLSLWQVMVLGMELLWVPAYLTLVSGHWRAARLFTVLAFIPFVGFAIRDTLVGLPVFARWSDVLVSALLLLTLAAFHRDTPPVPRRPWLIAFAAGIALTPAYELTFWVLPASSGWLLDFHGLYCILIVGVALVYLAGQLLGQSPAPSWALALALLSLAAFIGRAISLWEHAMSDPRMPGSVSLTIGIGQTVAVLSVGLALAAVANRGLRRFSPLDPATSTTLNR